MEKIKSPLVAWIIAALSAVGSVSVKVNAEGVQVELKRQLAEAQKKAEENFALAGLCD